MLNDIQILIVDDNLINRQYFKMAMKKPGYDILTAKSGPEAIEIAKNNAFGLILMDIRMLGMNGYETSQQIRKLAGHKRTPILATSADDIPFAEKTQFNGFLLKPINPKELFNIMQQYCPLTLKTDATDKPIFNQRQALEYAYNDREILQKLIHMFLNELPAQLSQLEDKCHDDAESCLALIHKMRGSCKTCGALLLDTELVNLANAIREQQSAHINSSYLNVIKAVDEFKLVINKTFTQTPI
jgi:CheY-like chemotaxis protein